MKHSKRQQQQRRRQRILLDRYGGLWSYITNSPIVKRVSTWVSGNYDDENTRVLASTHGEGRNLSRNQVRDLYHNIMDKGRTHVNNLRDTKPGESPVCARARVASDLRLSARHYTRKRGSLMDEWGLRARDAYTYGPFSSSRPSLVGASDAECQRVLDSAFRTNQGYDAKYATRH